MRGFADDSTDDVSVVGDPEARGMPPGGMPTMEASSVSSQASYLEAVSSAIATMPPDALRQSLEYVLPPVVRVLRAETEALVAGDTGASEPISTPKRRAARLEALESATRCVSLIARRAGRCGATKEAALELFAALVSTLGKAVSESALEHVRLSALDALRAALRAFDDEATVFLVDDERNLPILGYAISLLLDIARSEAERKKALGSRKVRRDALGALAELVDAAARGERMKRNGFFFDDARVAKESSPPNTNSSRARADEPSALAFFLPGVVSGCARAIAASVGSRAGHGAGPASAAEDSAAAEAAAAALATTCRAALADADFVPFEYSRSKEARAESRTSDDAEDSSANETLMEELRELAKKKMADPAKVSSEMTRAELTRASTLEAEDETKKEKTLRVVRDERWLSLAAPRVASAVSSAFTQLVTHTKPSTRSAAAIHALDVLETCGETLGEDARVALLSAALVVSSDPFPVAADPVDARLRRLKKSQEVSFFETTLQRAFRESLVSMPRSVRDEAGGFDGTDAGGSGGEGGAKARSVLAALRWMDPESFADALLADEGLRRDVAVSLVSCFEMEPTMAFSSVNRTRENENASRAAESETLWASRCSDDDASREIRARRARWLVCPSRGEGEHDTHAVVPAPAPPPRARFVSDAGLFASVARVARALGRNPVTLPALLETHIRATRETLAEARDAEAEDASRFIDTTDAPCSADAWRRKARAHVAVAVELLLGAAEARVECVRKNASKPASKQRRLKAHTAPPSSARNALEAFLGGGAWDLPTSPAAAAAAARALRRERRETHRRGFRARDKREAQQTFSCSSDEHENEEDSEEDEAYSTGFEKKKMRVSLSPRFVATARENALLSCLLVEAVGSVALAFGSEFVNTGGFLPTALCPLLLKLGDDDDSVRETAEGALFAVAREGGFLTFFHDDDDDDDDDDEKKEKKESTHADVSAAVSALVSKNADYVVDALSRRLRRLEAFPDAARFFAAVLGSNPAGGAARDLLPFLRDPIARAAEAISVTGRASFFPGPAASSDDGVCAFMRIMAQTSRAAAAEARAADDEIAEATRALEPLARAMAMAKREKSAATERRDDDEDDDDDDDEARKSSSLESLSSMDVSSLTRSLPALLASWRRRQTRLSRTSKLCAVMARASAPLAESGDARRRRLASEALASSLRACGFLASSFASDTPVRDALRALFPEEVPEDDSIPVQDRLVKVLPLVHEIWPHLVVATTGQPRGPSLRPAAFAASVDAIRACAEVSQPGNGGFVSRRFLRDAWPGLLRALRHGVPSLDRKRDEITHRLERVALIDGKTMTASYEYAANARLLPDGIEPGPGTETTRASATVRTCVLSLLATLASDERTREAMTDVAPFALAAVVPFAVGEADGESSRLPSSKSRDDASFSFRVRARAIDAVTALAAVNADAAWMELASRATGRDDAPVPVAPRFVEEKKGEEEARDARKKNGREMKGERRALPRLPSFRDVSPVPKTRTAPDVAEAAARLLAVVEGRAGTEAKS